MSATREAVAANAFTRGRAQESGWYGDHLPERDFPMLIELLAQASPPLEKSPSGEISLDDLTAAFEKSCRGEVLRSVVTFC
ncbi:hypothetical protein [Saccharopolyspora dendranthemae]|uniref:hypothetical protein n=1 Tax=Saccharopolyspora dendranthemae TaxID=1181886 RepID=UPI0011A3CFBA|nr:hypothetical protein [Saccharopolyspora dendranthemae]